MICNKVERNRLDIYFIRHVCVGHDGRRVAVDQHNLDTFFFQCLASLCSSVVEFRACPMTIGPEPMTRIFQCIILGILMSSFHGRPEPPGAVSGFHSVYGLLSSQGIDRTDSRCRADQVRFRMILHGEGREFRVLQAFDRFIVIVNMRNFQIRPFDGFFVYGISMILGSDVARPLASSLPDGSAAVAEFQLLGIGARANNWWPRQMPKIGYSPSSSLTMSTAYGTSFGSPGPLDN